MLNPYGFIPVFIATFGFIFLYLLLLKATLARKRSELKSLASKFESSALKLRLAIEDWVKIMKEQNEDLEYVDQVLAELQLLTKDQVNSAQIQSFTQFINQQNTEHQPIKDALSKIGEHLTDYNRNQLLQNKRKTELSILTQNGISGKIATLLKL